MEGIGFGEIADPACAEWYISDGALLLKNSDRLMLQQHLVS